MVFPNINASFPTDTHFCYVMYGLFLLNVTTFNLLCKFASLQPVFHFIWWPIFRGIQDLPLFHCHVCQVVIQVLSITYLYKLGKYNIDTINSTFISTPKTYTISLLMAYVIYNILLVIKTIKDRCLSRNVISVGKQSIPDIWYLSGYEIKISAITQ